MKHTETSTHNRTTKSGFIHSRINEDVKEQASFILEKIGLNVSDAIRLFLNQVVLRKGMPFPVCIPNKETIETIESAEKGENLEKITLEQLRMEFKDSRKKIKKHKKNRKEKE